MGALIFFSGDTCKPGELSVLRISLDIYLYPRYRESGETGGKDSFSEDENLVLDGH